MNPLRGVHSGLNPLGGVHSGYHPLGGVLVLALLGCGSAGAGPPGGGPPKKLRATDEQLDGKALLSSDAARAIAAGAGPLVVLATDVASEGDRLGAFVEIPPEECALSFARTSPSIADVDLFAYEDDGDAFASDESPDADAAIVVCPPHPRRLYFVARVMSGAGIVSLGVQSVPRTRADAVAKALGARGRPGDETGRLEAWPGLESKIHEHRALLGSHWEDVRRVAVPVDPHAASRVSLNIDPGRCLDILVTPSEEVASLEVVAEDAGGRVVARARDRDRDRTMMLCSAVPAEITVTIRPRASQGLVALVVARSPVGGEAEISDASRIDRVTQTLELPEARAALARKLSGTGLGAAKTVATGSARVGSRATVPVDLPAGCARLDAVSGRPLVAVVAELWDDQGALISEDRGRPNATLFACGPARKARVDVEALSRPGPFAIELRVDKTAPAALVAHPVAAARLLARLEAGGAPVDAVAASTARVATLQANRLERVPVTVPAGTCVEVVAALDSGGSGVDLRLVDAASGEGAVARGREVVSDRLCAGSASKQGFAELRLGAGKAEALVLTRSQRP